MRRREFLGIAAAGAASLAWPVAATEDSAALRPIAQPGLLEILRDERAVRELGRRYRELAPAETSAPVLEQLILGEAAPSSLHAAALREHIEAQVQQDFAASRTVTLDGWILSVTEARQCALFSLLLP